MGSTIEREILGGRRPDQRTTKLEGLNENGAAAMTGTDFLCKT
jgi:hypothetical protein